MDEIPYETGSYYIFDRGYNDYSRLYAINKLGATFIVRAKKNALYKRLSWKRRLENNVLSDSGIRFAGYYKKDDYPEPLRLIKYWDEENQREFTFLTNNFDLTALQVAELYHQRWQIELFFKWLKQHLKIKHFYGTSLNAVKIQVYVAIITFCLVAIVKHDMKLELTTYEVLQNDIRRWHIAAKALEKQTGQPTYYKGKAQTNAAHNGGYASRYKATAGFQKMPDTQIAMGAVAQNAGWTGSESEYQGW